MLQYESRNELDDLLLKLLDEGLAFNEYRKQHKTVDTKEYDRLLNTAISILRGYINYYDGMQGIFEEADKKLNKR